MGDESETLESTVVVAPRRRTRLGLGLLAFVIVSCCLFGGAAMLALDTIATSIARDRLRETGIECDDRFAVGVSWRLDVVLGPTTCVMTEGAIRSFELLDPATVELAGLEAQLVRGGRARVDVRFDPPDATPSGWGMVLETLSVPERVGILVHGAAELSALDLPRIELDAIEIARDGDVSAALTGVHLVGRTLSTPMTIAIDRIDLPTVAGPLGARAIVTIAPVRAEATPAHVELEGDLDVDASLPILGAMQRSGHLVVIADGLDGPSPRYDLRL